MGFFLPCEALQIGVADLSLGVKHANDTKVFLESIYLCVWEGGTVHFLKSMIAGKTVVPILLYNRLEKICEKIMVFLTEVNIYF